MTKDGLFAGQPPCAEASGLPPGESRLLRGFPAKDLVAVSARGAYITSQDGRRYLDLGGASHGVALLGHNHPRVVAAIQDHAARLIHVAGGIPNSVRGAFLERLHARLPPSLSRTFLANSGAEAMECAMKLASASGRTRFVAACDSFHGRTVGALGITHRPAFREPFAGLVPHAAFVEPGDVEALKAQVDATTAAVVLEPVQGEGGVRVLANEYLRAAKDIAHDSGALLILDEIQSGYGRTGTFLASSVTPDIVTLAKGVAGGLPIGICSMSEETSQRLPPGGHGSTYGGLPLACAAATAVLDVLDDDLMSRAAAVGTRFKQRLEALHHPAIERVTGRGMMVGVRLRVRPAPVLKALQAAGILALAGGDRGLRFLPPLTVDEADLDRTVEAVARCLG